MQNTNHRQHLALVQVFPSLSRSENASIEAFKIITGSDRPDEFSHSPGYRFCDGHVSLLNLTEPNTSYTLRVRLVCYLPPDRIQTIREELGKIGFK